LWWITILFVDIPLIIGIVVLDIFIKKKYELTKKNKIVLVTCGVIGLILWGGLIFGPVIVLLSIIIPPVRMSNEPLRVVQSVDLERYAGRWYEIAHIPIGVQKGCTNTTATYKPLPNGTIEVLNECKRDGKPVSIKGTAKVLGKKTNAILKVKFFGLFGADYWIIDLGKDYHYAVVGTPSKRYLWILCRALKMDDELYGEIIKRAQKNGFATERLVKTIHNK
jgi:apolipoprotein D and lipocalin family protein